MLSKIRQLNIERGQNWDKKGFENVYMEIIIFWTLFKIISLFKRINIDSRLRYLII